MRNTTTITSTPVSPRKHKASRVLQGAAAAVLVSVLAACGTGGVEQEEQEALTLEFTSDGLASQALDAATVRGQALVTVRASEEPSEVRFHLNDPLREGEPVFTDAEAPFEYELDTTALEDGVHALTIEADVVVVESEVRLSATEEFVVANTTPVEELPTPSTPTTSTPTGAAGEDTTAGADETPSTPLPAATLFVAPDGSGDGRSAASPTSIQRAVDVVRPGDVVYLQGGRYDIDVRFTRSGTASSPIVWTSAPGEWAIFDGSGYTPISSSARFHVAASWNVFENLEVRNGPQEGIYVNGAHDNVFKNIVTHGHQYSGIGNIGSDRNLYEGITTYDNFDDRNPRGLYGDDADGIALSSGDSNVVRRVVTYRNSDDGIDAWKSTNTLIEQVVAFDNGRGSHGNGNGIKAGGGNGHQNDTIVRNSIAFENKANGFDDNSGLGILFENNTAYGNGGYSFMGGSTTTRRNNIAVGGTVGMWGATDSNNSWDLGIGDPRFLSTTYGDDDFLALAPGSPAIGVGVGGADLGAIPARSTFADLTGPRVLGATAGLQEGTLALR